SGWFRNNDLQASSSATLHTIGYAMQGLLEIGASTSDERYIKAALRAAHALHEIWLDDHFLPGNFRHDWTSDVTWRCLPGEAQLVVSWLRLDQILTRSEFRLAAMDLLEQVKATQFLDETEPDLHGGLSG